MKDTKCLALGRKSQSQFDASIFYSNKTSWYIILQIKKSIHAIMKKKEMQKMKLGITHWENSCPRHVIVQKATQF